MSTPRRVALVVVGLTLLVPRPRLVEAPRAEAPSAAISRSGVLGGADYLEELRQMVAPMTESGRRGILGGNVARAYRLE